MVLKKYKMACIYHYIITEYFHCPKNLLCAAYSFLHHPQPLITTYIFMVSIVLPFPECHRVEKYEIIQHIDFSD